MVASGFLIDTAGKIGEVAVRVKAEQDAGLFQHRRGGAGGILAHSVGDEVFDGDRGEGRVDGDAFDQDDAAIVDLAVHRGGGDYFKTEAEGRVDPAERGVADADRLFEAESAEFFLKLRLDGRGDVDVAGHHRAAGVIFHRSAADEDRAGEAAGDHGFVEAREDGEGCDELRAVWSGHCCFSPPPCFAWSPSPR